MMELFPELEGLKGGRKQSWITNHLELVYSLNDQMGFTRAKEVLHMTDRTLVAALQKAERADRVAVTNGKRAIRKAEYVESLAYDIEKRMNTLQGRFDHQQQALAAGLDMIERVLLMLRLSITDKTPVKVSQPDFEAEADNLYVTSSGGLSLSDITIPKQITKGRGRRKTKGKRS